MKLNKEGKKAAKKVAYLVEDFANSNPWPSEADAKEAFSSWLRSRKRFPEQISEIIDTLLKNDDDEYELVSQDLLLQDLLEAAALKQDTKNNRSILKSVLSRNDLYGLKRRDDAIEIASLVFEHEETLDKPSWAAIKRIYRQAAKANNVNPRNPNFKKSFEDEVNKNLDPVHDPVFELDKIPTAWFMTTGDEYGVYLYADKLKSVLKKELDRQKEKRPRTRRRANPGPVPSRTFDQPYRPRVGSGRRR